MTPVREFLYFLITILIFAMLFFLWKEEPELLVEKPIVEEIYTDSLTSLLQVDETMEKLVADSIQTTPDPEVRHPLFFSTPLLFADDDSVRFSFLFDKLQHPDRSNLPVRVVYFGDSQIENDRITGALRIQLQQAFSGKGPGFVPLDQYYNTNHQLLIETSNNWEIKTFQDNDFINESLLFKNAVLTAANPTAWFRIKRIRRLDPQPDYQLMKLYYTAKDSCQVTVRQGRTQIFSGYLLPKEEVSTLDFQFNRTPDDIRFDFNASDTLNIAGLSLETSSGVLVDNIALRGLSYPTFESSNRKNIKQMLDQVNVGLFVLHFGVNLVPYQSSDYRYFRIHFQRQIDFLRSVRPQVPILIVGVSDMAKKQDGEFVSYSNIQTIKRIQYEIAMENQTAFWDLQSFMGGEGAMVRWVNHQPALGRKDYVHFSKRGANLIGRELAHSILNEMKTTTDSIQ